MTDLPTIKIGTVSIGTMLVEDLVDTFAAELELLGGKETDIIKEAYNYDFSGSGDEDEVAVGILEVLMDDLNDIAPPFMYFGASEGDGSDFGFWPDFDALEMAVIDKEVLKLDAGSEIPEGYVGDIMFVNDHGNVTMGYVSGCSGQKFKEIWSCV